MFCALSVGEGLLASDILQASPGCVLRAVDSDNTAEAAGQDLSRRYPGRFEFMLGTYTEFAEAASASMPPGEHIDGIVIDTALTPRQARDYERALCIWPSWSGESRQQRLDMRLDRIHGRVTAADVLKHATEKELRALCPTQHWRADSDRVVTSVLAMRQSGRALKTTFDLSAAVRECVQEDFKKGASDAGPRDYRWQRFSRLLFQHVNGIVPEVTSAIVRLFPKLKPGGKIAVIGTVAEYPAVHAACTDITAHSVDVICPLRDQCTRGSTPRDSGPRDSLVEQLVMFLITKAEYASARSSTGPRWTRALVLCDSQGHEIWAPKRPPQ
eukprot:TRINITY_DN13889_c0_g1_i2.p1 TRINITY_DN13889_c0_g1~~TRINITY_DN13889_c0_g1_i2.p1  ORF type:complete len:328 (+),score=1.01 TRINITY_DN13889_c0_g1_i2:425-1408(+)